MSFTHYKQDYFQWLTQQAHSLRLGQLSVLDVDNLAEEIEDLGKSEQRSLESDNEFMPNLD